MDFDSLLYLNDRIYILFSSSLYTWVLQYNHDHILAGHFGQNKILELIYYGYS